MAPGARTLANTCDQRPPPAHQCFGGRTIPALGRIESYLCSRSCELGGPRLLRYRPQNLKNAGLTKAVSGGISCLEAMPGPSCSASWRLPSLASPCSPSPIPNLQRRRHHRPRPGKYFKPEEVPEHGLGDRQRIDDLLYRGRGHPRRPPQRLGRREVAGRQGQEGRQQERQPDGGSVDVLCRLFQEGRTAGLAADYLPLQWRSRLLDSLAAHGRVRPAPRRHQRRHAHTGGALLTHQQQREPARCERSRLRRRARYRVQPHRRQGQGRRAEIVLGHGRRRLCLLVLHQRVPVALAALEFAEISFR